MQGLLRHVKSLDLYSEGTEELLEDLGLKSAMIGWASIKILHLSAE